MKQFLQQISRALVAKFVLVAVCVLAIVGVVAYLSHQMKGSSVEVGHTQHIGVTPTQVERIFLPEARASRPPVTGSGKELAAHIHQAAGPYLTEGTNEGRGPRNG